MGSIEKSTAELIESVKSGSAYKRFRKCEKALKKYPGLSEKLDKLRGDIFRLYNEPSEGELLENTEEKSYVIAGMVGYEEPTYFSYVFKKQFGVSPAKYRQTLTKDQ